MTAEQGGTTSIEVRVAIRRDIVACFEPEALSRDTGIPVAVLLTLVDTWADDIAENFADYVLDDSNYFSQSIGDWSSIEKYQIKERK